MVSFPSLVVGGLVALLGAALLVNHQQSFARRKLQGILEEFEHQFHVRQYRRRMQTSGMLVAIGVLIIGGDAIIDWDAPINIVAILWVTMLLLLSLWVVLLGLGDWVSSRTHNQTLISHNENMQHLHRTLLEKASKKENGHAAPADGAQNNRAGSPGDSSAPNG